MEDRLKKIVAEHLGVEADEITATSTLADLGADSLDYIEICMSVEDAFDIEIGDDQAEQIEKFGDLLKVVQQ